MDRNNNKLKKNYVYAQWQVQQAVHTTNRLSSPRCSTRAILPKSLTLIENVAEFSVKKVRCLDCGRKMPVQRAREISSLHNNANTESKKNKHFTEKCQHREQEK